jgi:hypothetical protein
VLHKLQNIEGWWWWCGNSGKMGGTDLRLYLEKSFDPKREAAAV